MAWALVIGGGAALAGAVISSNATKSAAGTQANATQGALDENRREFDTIQQNQQPWLAAGTTALGKLQTGVDTPLDPSTVQLDPGYQFGLQQGQQAIDRKTAAAGGRISGAALKSAAQYGTNYATTGYNDAYNRVNQARSDRLNRLAALANIGQTATQQVNSAGQTFVGQNAGLITGQGNASAAATLAQGNIWGNAGNQLAAIYGRQSGNAPQQSYNPNAYSTPGGGDTYYGQGQNWGV